METQRRLISDLQKNRMGLVPLPIAQRRKQICKNCNCGVDFDQFCSYCPMGNWGPSLCSEDTFISEPKLSQKIKIFAFSMRKWAQSFFKKTPLHEHEKRLKVCKGCLFFDKKSFGGTGKCKKCGCSIWAKTRIKTSKCPIGKW